jgi:hypothetical protein
MVDSPDHYIVYGRGYAYSFITILNDLPARDDVLLLFSVTFFQRHYGRLSAKHIPLTMSNKTFQTVMCAPL